MQRTAVWLHRAYWHQYLPWAFVWRMKSVTDAQHLGCSSLQGTARLPFLLPPLTPNSPALLFYFCGLLVCKVITGNKTRQRNSATLMTWGLRSPPLLTFKRCWESCMLLGSTLQKWTISHCHQAVGEEARGMPSLHRVLIAQWDSHSCSAPNVNMDSPIHHWPYFLSTHPGERDDLVPAAGTNTMCL